MLYKASTTTYGGPASAYDLSPTRGGPSATGPTCLPLTTLAACPLHQGMSGAYLPSHFPLSKDWLHLVKK